jgi:hypothetical protein
METKPFSLQAPEAIAKEYAGNKQKIAQAAQMGIVDPTAAVLAGMFIDRMRNAAQAEAAPQQTVAQQVFAPPAPAAPPAGLGALPQGAMPPEAMAGMPQAMPQGMPQGMPQEAMMPPQGMPAPEAMMAEGGLAGLEVPDDMFMESDNYAGGGMVAFQDGGMAGMPRVGNLIAGQDYVLPDYTGRFTDVQNLLGVPGGPALDEYKALLMRERGPEAEKRNKKQDLAEFLTQIGFGMASGKSPNFLQNLSAAAAPAGQAAVANVKERKKEQRQLLKDQVDMELSEYGVKSNNYKTAVDIENQAATLMSQGLDRKNAFKMAADTNANRLEEAHIQAGGMIGAAEKQLAAAEAEARKQTYSMAEQLAKADTTYKQYVTAGNVQGAMNRVDEIYRGLLQRYKTSSGIGTPSSSSTDLTPEQVAELEKLYPKK